MALIDREALLEVPNVRKVTEYDEAGFRMTYLAVPLDAIEDAPAVDAEPVRRGEWILRAHDKGVNYLWTVTAYCSECCDEEQEIWSGYFPGVPDYIAKDVSLDSAKTVELSNYCPNCGAKMKEEET